MKKKVIVAGSIALMVCGILVAGFSKTESVAKASKPENLQELLQNFNPGDEAVAYAADTLI